MQPHVRLYHKYFDITPGEFIPCEVCQQRAVDIHHIEARGMGGTAQPDDINNLMALCRECHHEYGDIKALKPMLTHIHQLIIKHYHHYGTLQY